MCPSINPNDQLHLIPQQTSPCQHQIDSTGKNQAIIATSVLARIDKFSNLPVINFFFTVIKTKDQLFVRGIWGDEMREKARKSAV